MEITRHNATFHWSAGALSFFRLILRCCQPRFTGDAIQGYVRNSKKAKRRTDPRSIFFFQILYTRIYSCRPVGIVLFVRQFTSEKRSSVQELSNEIRRL